MILCAPTKEQHRDDQDIAAQVAALRVAKCDQILREKPSGGRWDRPELHGLLDRLRQGDVLVVWKPDHLSRSLRYSAELNGIGSANNLARFKIRASGLVHML